jgi:eukaryotic translation initiation factor 2C
VLAYQWVQHYFLLVIDIFSDLQKMVNGGVVSHWACLNFSRSVQENAAAAFCSELARMCHTSGMVMCSTVSAVSLCLDCIPSCNVLKLVCCMEQDFHLEPIVPVRSVRPEHSERALTHLCEEVKKRTKDKDLDLLVAIMPDSNGSLYGV